MAQDVYEIPINKIEIGDRQRTDYGDILGLQLSIEMHGLLYPIIVEAKQDGMFKLLAGGRRLQAYTNLKREAIPAFLKETLDTIQAQELELEENIQRKELTYLERARAIRDIDKLKREKYQSALPMLRLSRGWSQKDTAEELGISEAKVSEDIKIAEFSELYPEIKEFSTKREILRYIRRVESGLIELAPDELSKKVLDSFTCKRAEDLLRDIPVNTVSLGIVDVREYANYEHILKEQIFPCFSKFGGLFIFCELFSVPLIQKYASECDMKCSPKPAIWYVKGQDDYIPILYASCKREYPPLNFNLHQAIAGVKDPDHTREKPYQLYYNMIMSQTTSQDFIVDFTAYNIECVKVCLDHNRNCIAACPDQALYELKKHQLTQKKEG